MSFFLPSLFPAGNCLTNVWWHRRWQSLVPQGCSSDSNGHSCCSCMCPTGNRGLVAQKQKFTLPCFQDANMKNNPEDSMVLTKFPTHTISFDFAAQINLLPWVGPRALEKLTTNHLLSAHSIAWQAVRIASYLTEQLKLLCCCYCMLGLFKEQFG